LTRINLFRNETDTQSFPAGHTIFEIGDPVDGMYVVIEGEVEIMHNHRVLEVVMPGGIFGEMALVSDQPRSAQAITRTECKLVAVDVTRFTYLVQQTPYFAIDVMRVLAERLRRETEREQQKAG
jgi:CRP-like cAMP-binding protein